MSKEQAIKFLEDYKVNRSLMEKVDDIFEDNPDLSDNELWVKAARDCGYMFTPEELDEVFHQKFAEENEAGVKAAAAVLDEAELNAVAGGGEDENCRKVFWCPSANVYDKSMKHGNCAGTFVDRENCWNNDGCDSCYNMYSDYECKRTGDCEYAFIHR